VYQKHDDLSLLVVSISEIVIWEQNCSSLSIIRHHPGFIQPLQRNDRCYRKQPLVTNRGQIYDFKTEKLPVRWWPTQASGQVTSVSYSYHLNYLRSKALSPRSELWNTCGSFISVLAGPRRGRRGRRRPRHLRLRPGDSTVETATETLTAALTCWQLNLNCGW
jgi:hypothetical protein